MQTSPLLPLAVALGALACSGSEKDDAFGGGGGRSDYVIPGGTGGDAGDSAGGGNSGGGGGDAGSGDAGGGSAGGTDGGSDSGEPALVGTGYGEGDTAYDLVGTDGNGGPWSLHDQLGTPVVLIVGNAYNAQVTDMLDYMSSLDANARPVFFAKYDENTENADEADASRWQSSYGITAIVQPGAADFTTWGTASPPRLYVIDAAMTIQWVNSGFTSQSQLETKL
ncbi:MAG: hypothetical protein VX265_17325 [Myxococcota bacterium]|nr:hypothetical protein [Myxococcota bacterium]